MKVVEGQRKAAMQNSVAATFRNMVPRPVVRRCRHRGLANNVADVASPISRGIRIILMCTPAMMSGSGTRAEMPTTISIGPWNMDTSPANSARVTFGD